MSASALLVLLVSLLGLSGNPTPSRWLEPVGRPYAVQSSGRDQRHGHPRFGAQRVPSDPDPRPGPRGGPNTSEGRPAGSSARRSSLCPRPALRPLVAARPQRGLGPQGRLANTRVSAAPGAFSSVRRWDHTQGRQKAHRGFSSMSLLSPPRAPCGPFIFLTLLPAALQSLTHLFQLYKSLSQDAQQKYRPSACLP